MNVTYDPEADILTIVLKEGKVAESDETRDGVIFDYDRQGKLLAFEMLDASKHLSDPTAVTVQIAPSNRTAQ